MRRNFNRKLAYLLGGGLIMAACPVRAESAEDAAVAQAVATQTYGPDYFARYAPRNAVDMLFQLPGFVIRNDEAGRGLGQASTNVLVNGQRLSGKSEDTLTQLGRIPAANVLKIEIVDAATLDVPGLTGQVANIFVKSTGLTGQFSWRGEARAHFTDPLFTRAEVSVSGTKGPVEFTLALGNQAGRFGAGGPSEIRLADGSLFESRDIVLVGHNDQPKISGAFKIDGPGSSVGNLNLSYRRRYFGFDGVEPRDRVNGVDYTRLYMERESGYDYEIGGDFEFKLGLGRLKLIGLSRFEHEPYFEQSVFDYDDSTPNTGDRYEQVTDSGEKIARAEYSWKMGGADWQLSAEAAFNKLESVARLFTLAPAGTFDELPFPGGSGGVKEDRYESILSYSRPLSSKLSLQLSIGGEFSRLSQTGANAVVREFKRPKGSFALAWAPRKGLDLSFKLNRRVGQLEFEDFLARVFLGDDNANSGNGELVPPQSWEAELEVKKDLGRWGNTTLRLFDYRIEDLVDIIPIGTDGESRGNIDHARRHGIEWSSTVQLAPLGIKGAKIDTRLYLEKTRVNDPLTGLPRPISGTEDRVIEVSFRHDIPKTNWAYGVDFTNLHVQNNYRLSEVGLNWEGPNWMGIYVENKNVFGLTVNGRIGNVLGARSLLDRVVHEGYRDRTPVAFTEHRNRLIGPIFVIGVKGNF